jgi:hypothetical protein
MENGPHGGMGMGPRDVIDDPKLPRGSVQVMVRTADGSIINEGMATIEVLRHSVSQGESKRNVSAPVSADGSASFTSLPIGSEYAFQVQVNHAGVSYTSSKFILGDSMGKRVAIRVYETKTDIDAVPVGVQSFVFLSPKDEHIQVEQLIRFTNIGAATWVPTHYFVRLPSGYKALKADSETHVKAEEVANVGLRVSGYVKPGSEDLVFRYQLPYSSSDTLHIALPLPARVGHLRVFVEGEGKIQARADNMPPFEPTESDNGQKLIFTETMAKPGDDQISEVSIVLSNVPTPGPARWYAVGLVVVAVIGGLVAATRKDEDSKVEAALSKAGLDRLVTALLEEIEGLEKAHLDGKVGPKTYEQDRRKLVDRLAKVLAVHKS